MLRRHSGYSPWKTDASLKREIAELKQRVEYLEKKLTENTTPQATSKNRDCVDVAPPSTISGWG